MIIKRSVELYYQKQKQAITTSTSRLNRRARPGPRTRKTGSNQSTTFLQVHGIVAVSVRLQ